MYKYTFKTTIYQCAQFFPTHMPDFLPLAFYWQAPYIIYYLSLSKPKYFLPSLIQ